MTRPALTEPRTGLAPAGGGGAEAERRATRREIALLNPGRFPEAGARRLRPWVEALVTELAPHADSLAVRFTGDRGMRRVNRQFRGKDTTTDVLSFPGAEGPEGWHLGDVLISVPAARRQAEERGEPAEREVRRLILHGLLHCLGHDHETDGGTMRRLERRLARRWLEADA